MSDDKKARSEPDAGGAFLGWLANRPSAANNIANSR
jgi:hypothetical protein